MLGLPEAAENSISNNPAYRTLLATQDHSEVRSQESGVRSKFVRQRRLILP